MCKLPEEIPNDEKIVRAIKTPYHIRSNGKLKHQAFKPKAGVSAVSVIRHEMGSDFCKDKAVEIATPGYCGLAVVPAGGIRDCGSTVIDHRADYCGHAHVDHGFALLEENEPGNPQSIERMHQRCSAIVDKCRFHSDPDPAGVGWSGAGI